MSSSSGFPPQNEPLAILSALLGGGRYGLKIRLPHALVMTALFRRELSAKEKIRSIVKLTMEHARNLAAFATIYKNLPCDGAICFWLDLMVFVADSLGCPEVGNKI
mmetsp:Transcript_34957/g.104281  ORF Transcript_34957/g.104281 Transcript_34957/m.104281 type:complete len:106 (-) Transcript_34957:794-1111(-)